MKNYRRATTLIFLVSFIFQVFGQTDDANFWLKKAQAFNQKSAWDSLKISADRAVEIIAARPNGAESADFAEALDWQARYLAKTGKGQAALETYQKSLDLRQRVFGEPHMTIARSFNNIGIVYIFLLENFEKAIEWQERSLAMYQRLGDQNGIADLQRNLATTYRRAGKLQKGIDFALLALETAQKIYPETNLELADFFNGVGNAYFWAENPGKSVEFYQKSLEIGQKYLPENNPDLLDWTMDLAAAYTDTRHFDLAKPLFKKLLELCDKDPTIDLRTKSTIYGNAAAAKTRMGNDLEGAFENLKKANEIDIQLYGAEHPRLFWTYRQLTQMALMMLNFEAAEEWSRHERIVAAKIPLNPDNRAESLRLSARIAEGKKHWSLADSTYQIAAQKHIFDYKKYAAAGLMSNDFAIRLLGSWIFLKHARFAADGNPEHLRAAADLAQKADEIQLAWRSQLDRNDSKNRIAPSIRPAVQAGLLANVRLFNQANDAAAGQAAFLSAEKNRSLLLFENVRENTARQLNLIPADLLNALADVQKKLAAAEKKQIDLFWQGKSPDDPEVLAVGSSIFELQQQLDLLQKHLETEHSDYFKLKYDLSVASVADVQRYLLAPDQALLEYFIGDSSIFIFKIEKSKFEVQEVKKDFPLEKWVAELRDATTNFNINPTKFENQYSELAQIFTERSHQLYQKLIAPIAQNLPPRLVIVPDGVLGYLPFEALLTKPISTAADRWQQHNYLINKHSVQYCPSATMLREMTFRQTKTAPTVEFFGFAPYYKGDTTTLGIVFPNDPNSRREGLGELKSSGKEVFELSKLMQGKYLTGDAASKPAFLAAASTARVLHLATHGQANDRAGDYCFLAFAPNPTAPEHAVLFAREIYNLNLNADLVVLSACETGIGQLQNGEGIISLARAFAYAGAKSIVTSLWSVSDLKTMKLMIDFYTNLQKGAAKDLALRQAKLDFLKKNKGQDAHPFFWAGFVGMGSVGSF